MEESRQLSKQDEKLKRVNDEPVVDFSDAVKEVMKDSKSDNYHKHNNRDNKKKKDNRKRELS